MKKVVTKSDNGFEVGAQLHPANKAGKHEVEVWTHSYIGLARTFLTRKQAKRHFTRALALITQDSPFKLVRKQPDEGFSIAYFVLDKDRQAGVIQRQEGNGGTWCVQVGGNEHSEGTSYGVRWAALKFLEGLNTR